jgi:hypothetical protein
LGIGLAHGFFSFSARARYCRMLMVLLVRRELPLEDFWRPPCCIVAERSEVM